jgi:hypothetical protein
MATKSQLKQYFETGKIPTQAQFGELIDFIQPLITDNVTDRPNQTLLFGGDTPNPIINGLRIIHYYQNDDNIYNYWIFTNEAGVNNRCGISIPMFVIKCISSEEPNLSLDMANLEYAIPTRKQLASWVEQGYDCDTADAYTLHSALTYLTFKPWLEGGGSSDNSNFKTCEIGTSKSAIFEVVEVLYDTKRIKIPVSIRFLSVGLSDVNTHSIWNLNIGANIIDVQNDWNNILNNWKDSHIPDLVIKFRNDYFINGGGSLTVNSVISEPGQYNIVAFGYNSTSLFTAFELTLTRNTNGHFIVGLLKQTEYIVANGQFRPKITWFSLAAKNLGNMPYYTGSKTFGDIVSFAKANLNSNTSEPNLQN